jgi:hypothetical protein
MSISTNQASSSLQSELPTWASELHSAAIELRKLLFHVDSTCVSLWEGPALRTAAFRYTEIFLPMYAAHLCHTNQITLSGPQHARAQALLETAQAVFLAKKVQSTKQFRIMFGSSILYNNGEWTSSDSKAPAELVERFTRPFRAGLDGIGRACPISPLDVAFCWLLHRLSPTAYEADCLRMFGAPLPAGDATRAGPQALHHAWVGNADHDECVVARL